MVGRRRGSASVRQRVLDHAFRVPYIGGADLFDHEFFSSGTVAFVFPSMGEFFVALPLVRRARHRVLRRCWLAANPPEDSEVS